jgi:hypothetical protein
MSVISRLYSDFYSPQLKRNITLYALETKYNYFLEKLIFHRMLKRVSFMLKYTQTTANNFVHTWS